MAQRMRMIPGLALDLTVNDPEDDKPWDFNDEEKRNKAKKLIGERRAVLLVGSPMCSAFSQIQNLNFAKMTEEQVHKIREYGRKHLEFCMELYETQVNNGLYFLHEHPEKAKSWKNEKVERIASMRGVEKVTGHMCQYGMTQEDDQGIGWIKKPTTFMTNSSEIAQILKR